MSNLVLIFLAAIVFILQCFFGLFFFLGFIFQYLFDEESCFFVLSNMPLMGSFQSHDPSNRFEGLA
jgi:hypothetical protein